MSQSRFSIVLVGVSALLRRPLVSRLRPADGERSSWVVFTARVGRFDSGFRSAGWPRAHCFRFSACTASELPLGELAFGLPLRKLPSAGSFFRLPLRKLPFGGLALLPSASEIALGGLAFGFTASAFRNAPIRGCPRRVGLRAHCFRFSARTASEIALGELAFGLTASAFRHAALRRLPSAGWFFRLPFRSCRWASWPSGSPLPLFGMHRFAPPHCRSEDRRSTPTRHLFHFKTLIPTC